MRPKDDPLEALDPFLCARSAVGFEVVCPLVGDDGKVNRLLVRVGDVGGYRIAQVDLTIRKVEIGCVAVVCENIAL